MAIGPIRIPFASGPLPAGAAMLAIRVVLGPLLAYHGFKKIEGGVEKFVATVDRSGFPFPELLARVTIAIELLGGICLALGLLTRVWGALATGQFVLIVAKLKWDVGVLGGAGRTGFELELLYAVTAAALMLAGPGMLALDHLLGLETNPAARASSSDRARTRARVGP